MARIFKTDIEAEGKVSGQTLASTQSSGDEGGQIDLAIPVTNTSLSGSVAIDIYQNKLRIFETGGTNRGAYIDLTAASAGVASNLLAGGGGGAAASDSFKTISVSGQSDVVADSSTDTLNLIAGTNVSITTNATSDSITINSSGSLVSIDTITYPDYITFDTTPETTSASVGTIYWDSGESAPAVILNNNVDLKLGQENVVLVANQSGSAIPKGSVVYINGAAGQRPTITLSDADTEITSSKTLGLTAESISDGAEGFVTTFGVLRGVNTDGLTEGAMLWLSSTAGGYTTTVPAEPAHSVFLGYVVKASASAGEIFVNVQNGYELTELHGVLIEDGGNLNDNEILAYDTTSGLWINQTALEAGFGTAALTASTTYATNAFTTISTTSGTSPVADSTSDTLTISAGSGISVTGDSTTDTITIANTGYYSGGTDVALADGGTNASLTASNGGIVYSTASAMAILSGTATAGKHLQSGAAGAPSWTTATFPSTATLIGTFLRADGTNWVASSQTLTLSGNTTIGSSTNTVSLNTSGNTSVTLPTSGTLLTTTGSGSSLTFGIGSLSLSGNLTTSGAGSIALTITGNTSLTLPTSGTLIANPMTTSGDLIYGGASGVPTRLPGNTSGTSTAVLTSSSAAGVAGAPIWTATTGSGNVVLAGSPTIDTINTSVTTTGTASLWNTGITGGTIAIGGAISNGSITLANSTGFSGTINIANASTSPHTVNISNGAGTSNKTINIGTLATTGTTAITLGSSSGATSTIALQGAVTATSLTVTGAAAFNGGFSVDTTAFSVADVTGNTSISGTLAVTGNTTITGDLAVNGGDITSTSASVTLFNTTATTMNIGGAATTVNVGASAGLFTVRGKADIIYDTDANSGAYGIVYAGSASPTSPAVGDLWIDDSGSNNGTNIIRWRALATAGQTVISGTDTSGTGLQYTAGYEQVYINGVLLYRGTDYTATNGTSITITGALTLNDTIEVISPQFVTFADYYTQGQIDTKLGASGWTSYTPTLTGFSLGNGTIVGYYTQIGKTVHCYGQFTFQSTSVASTTATITLPVTAARNSNQSFIGKYVAGTFAGEGLWTFASTTTATLNPLYTSAQNNYVGLGNLNAPGTWAANSYFTWSFTYEAA